MTIGGHQSHAMSTDVWLTPPFILKALGAFDLDPCSPVDRPWPTASQHFTIFDDGLKQPWSGRVWMNPPYGKHAAKWMERLADHDHGTALIFARTETAIFFPWVWEHASAVLFLKGRLRFFNSRGMPGGGSGAPSVLIAYGAGDALALQHCGLPGKFVPLKVEAPGF